jgi:hypothetical protein
LLQQNYAGRCEKIFRLLEAPISGRSINSHSDADAKRHLQSAAIELNHTSCPTGEIEKIGFSFRSIKSKLGFTALSQEREAREWTMISYNERSLTAPDTNSPKRSEHARSLMKIQ